MDTAQTELTFAIMYTILGTIIAIEIVMVIWLIVQHYELKRKDIYKLMKDESHKKTDKDTTRNSR